MRRLHARLAKLEAAMGKADESRYWQARFDLQPALHKLYWQSQREGWSVMAYLKAWSKAHKDLPLPPNTPEFRQRGEQAKEEILRRLAETRERLDMTHELGML